MQQARNSTETRTVLTVDSFATVSDRKACDMLKVFKFRQEKNYETWMLVKFQYSLPSLHKSSIHLKLCGI